MEYHRICTWRQVIYDVINELTNKIQSPFKNLFYVTTLRFFTAVEISLLPTTRLVQKILNKKSSSFRIQTTLQYKINNISFSRKNRNFPSKLIHYNKKLETCTNIKILGLTFNKNMTGYPIKILKNRMPETVKYY